MSASLALFALTLVLALAIAALLAGLCVVLVRTRVLALDPVARHRALLVLAVLPLLVGITSTASASLPAVLSLALPAIDHCDLHDDHHAHLCFVHGPHAVAPGAWSLLAALLLFAALRVGGALARLRRQSRLVEALVSTAQHDAATGATLVESALPLCMTAGLLRPRIVIARPLFASVSSCERDIMLAHEQAHVRRRDALSTLVARAACCFHVPALGRWMVRELEIAAEQACDEAAASGIGDRDAVAQAILAMSRAWADHTRAELPGPAFAVHAVERRVLALLDDAQPQRSLALPLWCLLIVLAMLLAAAGALHHVAESMLSTLAV
jgi:beta-lactamase regulating signal transducer with metallopeptidase domain